MKSKKNNLDEKIRDKIYEHSTPVPADMWNRIEQSLDAQDSKANSTSRNLEWFGLADVFILLLFVLPFCNPALVKNKAVEPIHAKQANTASATKSDAPESNQLKSSTEVTSKTKVNQLSQEKYKIIKETLSSETPVKTASQPIPKYKSKAGIMVLPQVNLMALATNQQNLNVQSHEETKTIHQEVIDLNSPAILQNQQLQEKQKNQENENLIAFKNDPMVQNHPQTETSVDSTASANQVVLNALAMPIKDSLNENALKQSQAPTEQISNTTKASAFAIELFATPNYYQLEWKEKAGGNFVNRLDSSGIKQKSWTAGIRAVYPLTAHFAIKAGLSYSRLTTKYQFATSRTTTNLNIDSVSNLITLQDPFNAPLIIRTYDSSYVTSELHEILSTDTRLSMLDLPLLVSFQVERKKFAIGISTGVALNLLFQKKGTSISAETTKIINVNNAQNSLYKKTLGLQYLAGIECKYSVSKTISLFLEPQFAMLLKPATNAASSYSQRWNKLGVNAGVTYHLKK